MPKKLTTHLLIQNHEALIEDCLKSIRHLDTEILAGDIGSHDGTAKICRKYGVKVIPIVLNNDYGRARNTLLSYSETSWNFYVEPWEILIAGHDEIVQVIQQKQPLSFNIQVLQGQVLGKEVRLWSKKLMFDAPVFESLIDREARHLTTGMLYSRPVPDDYDAKLRLIELWKKNRPTSYEPYYYHAHLLLRQNKFQEFAAMAEHYLFHEKQGISSVMMRYYLAMVLLLALNDPTTALKYVLECLVTRPLMAEFWCLLGDILYKAADFEKAQIFYQNAIFLGSKRLKNDDWPMEIAKYKEYPQKMIESCQSIVAETKYLVKK